MTLLYYESLFSGLNLHTAGGFASPHKVAVLLAVTDLIEDGTLAENWIEYSESLISAFAERFKGLRTEGEYPRLLERYQNELDEPADNVDAMLNWAVTRGGARIGRITGRIYPCLNSDGGSTGCL